jgi:hypothetical protein
MLKKAFLIILLALILVPAASAQDTFCGDLSEQDCNLLTRSRDAMAQVETLSFDFSLDMSGSGTGELAMPPFDVTFRGDGSLSTAFINLDILQNTTPNDLLQNDYAAVFQQFLTAFQGDMRLDISLPDGATTSLAAIMQNGVFYLDTGAINNMDFPVWVGIDLSGLAALIVDDTLPELDGLSGADFAPASTDYLSIRRLGDRNVMGQTVAVFETTLDYAAVFSDPAFKQSLEIAMGEMAGGQGAESLADMLLAMDSLADLLDGSVMRSQQWINTTSGLIQHFEVSMDFNMDMSAVTAASDRMSITVRGDVNLFNFNEPLNISPPENVPVIDPFALGLNI